MPVVNNFTALLSGQSWTGTNSTNRAVIVTYSFETVAQSYLTTANFTQAFLNSFSTFGAAEKTAARDALAQWANASGITFLEVPAGQGDIRFGSYNFALDPKTNGSDGYAFYPGADITQFSAHRDELGGDIFIKKGSATSTPLLLHEIGHALGLKHPGEGVTTLDPTFDNQTNTVMSYNGTPSSALRGFDLQAVEYVYGNSASDGTHVSSWSWNAASRILTQTGSAASEKIFGVSVRDIINGGLGNDWIGGFQGNDAITGDDGEDSLFGNEGNDVLDGGSEADWLDGGTGTDRMTGGGGNDTFIVDVSTDATIEAADGGDDSIYSFVTLPLRVNVERLYLQGTANINGTGNTLDNVIGGNAGSNILNGLAGADYMFGLGGNDTYYVDNIFDVTDEGANQGSDVVQASLDWELGANIETLYISGAAIDATGNELSNFIYGNVNANVIDGASGADRLYGYQGNDTYIVDSTGDLVSETIAGATGGTDLVVSSVNQTLSVNVEDLILTSTGTTIGTGNNLVNTLSGGAGVNFLDGKLGSDTLSGKGGADHFVFTTALGADNIDTITDFSVIDDFIRLDDAVFLGLAAGFLAAAAFHTGATAADASDRIIYDSLTGALFFDSDGTGAAAAQQFAALTSGLSLSNADFFVF
jgi:Ca2+-binding RTX toxin-like protein